MRRDHLNALFSHLFVQPTAIVSAVADEVLTLGLDHVEVEAELYQTHFVMVRGMCAHRNRQAVAIYNRHDFQAFTAPCRADLGATTFGHREGRINETFLFVDRAPLSRSSLATSVKMPRSTSLRHHF